MDRRQFIGALMASAVAPALPVRNPTRPCGGYVEAGTAYWGGGQFLGALDCSLLGNVYEGCDFQFRGGSVELC